MSLPRLVFITRRFWPRLDGAGRMIAELAGQLAERGAACTVLTTLHHPAWPRLIRCRGVAVWRLAPPPLGCRSEARFARTLSRWLREHGGQYDLVCASGLWRDAWTVLRAVGRDVPVVLRAERAGRGGDCFRQIDTRQGHRIKTTCMRAAALVGTSRRTHQELLAAGYPRRRVHHIERGVAQRPPRTEASRAAARRALAESGGALDLPLRTPMVLYAGPLDAARGLDELLAAWRPLAARLPEAQLWLAGDGPWREELRRLARTDALPTGVVPVGVFDSIEILLDAADLFVLPGPGEDPSVALLEAMAAGLAVVAVEGVGSREAFVDREHGLLVPPGQPAAMTAAVASLLERPELAARLGAAARARVEEAFSLASGVDAHAALFERLAWADDG